jgi:hypothetical protein
MSAIPQSLPKNPAQGLDILRLMQAARVAPDLATIEWEGAAFDKAPTLGGRRRRIRDRYVAARFPGIARTAADLANAPQTIKAARLLFEEEEAALATELLEIAIEESPLDESLYLARLEILFLARDREGFVAAAREFRAAHAKSAAWDEVVRLGRAIAPDEAFFGNSRGPRAHEHYGPWPHLPNWIQAPWDLTGEVLAADFHRAVHRGHATLQH